MIKILSIQNYQSHKDTILELHKNVNSIVGDSDQGKTAIIRALLWLINNRPLGDRFVSYWSKDEKDNIINPTQVEIETDKGTVIRKKDKKYNGYIVDGKELDAIGTDIPEDIKKVINIDEVNIQKQMDSPFLLSQSSGEVARFFNKTIKLDLIDNVLSVVESKKRKEKNDLKNYEENYKEINDELEKLEWINEAKGLLEKINRFEDKIKIINEEINKIEINKERYNSNKEILNKIKNIDKIDKLIKEYELNKIECNKIEENRNRLLNQLNNYIKCKDTLKKLKNINLLDGYVKEIKEINDKSKEIQKEIEELNYNIDRYVDNKDLICDLERDILEAQSQMPSICPTCGQEIKG